jgi:hypothetical protein
VQYNIFKIFFFPLILYIIAIAASRLPLAVAAQFPGRLNSRFCAFSTLLCGSTWMIEHQHQHYRRLVVIVDVILISNV